MGFFEEVHERTKASRREIIEKDYQLHRILKAISEDEYLSKTLAFKGGTCLIKAYLGYYRFSEDLDFTWKDQEMWEGLTRSNIKKQCSREINGLVKRFKDIMDHLGLDFTDNKDEGRYIHISSGGRMVLFYVNYHSEVLKRVERLKIEISFTDEFRYPTLIRTLDTYANHFDTEEMEFYYPEQLEEYSSKVRIDCYDPREIFIEKCRAALTRKVYKFRDMIDIYMLKKENGFEILDHEEDIIVKTKLMLDLYRRYNENIRIRENSLIFHKREEELKLFLISVPEDLDREIDIIQKDLEIIRDRILNEIDKG